MAEYKSKFARLSFYVNGERKQFSQGRYSTEDKDEIAVLDGLPDAQKAEAETKAAEQKPKKAEAKAGPSKPKRKPAATTKSTKPKDA